MKIYNTNYNSFIKYITGFISKALFGPWKVRSIGLISLLVGYYLASILTTYFLVLFTQRSLVVIPLVILVEISVRLRRALLNNQKESYLLILDNIRIGITYAVVLEAFKLGS
ncbi:hypothetical protein EV11_1451 [Prochlorococcus sp. SS52]|uniref:Uncharacterized secreted or membrane protein n=2 Tax=Prochlorococcaceae TaxID=2881426 RepID=Q7VBW0_PROMA|nr:Uncharacterized secreted or membrane protein [Prochlorococcus marinus subsp. marinus str. CCMP1375]KGG18957.1 hypothetical protein EV08_1444 [Prochlorococcus marinus str. SS2]KGG23504.1 hypothetical protein EV09_1128 [Prochlorococcus marinus str. SS35]KGG32260.1 hypothetical protein EV10_1375 [Prochlorococcus marinus str. SS51]KGG35049.1 hypothetical protein EV11_1451 [Prochlorococcus sp. SS52]